MANRNWALKQSFPVTDYDEMYLRLAMYFLVAALYLPLLGDSLTRVDCSLYISFVPPLPSYIRHIYQFCVAMTHSKSIYSLFYFKNITSPH